MTTSDNIIYLYPQKEPLEDNTPAQLLADLQKLALAEKMVSEIFGKLHRYADSADLFANYCATSAIAENYRRDLCGK